MTERQQTSWKSGSLALVLLATLGLLVVVPLIVLFGGALPGNTAELNDLRDLLRDISLQHTIMRTLTVALLACGLASVIAIPAAFLAIRASTPVRILIQSFGFLPLTMPPFVSAAVLRHFADTFSQTEAAQSFVGLSVQGNSVALILVFALHYLPFILFSLIAGLMRIDHAVTESARNLGASRLFVWRRITLPLATPAFAVGASLVILRIIADVGTPLMLGIDGMLAPQIVLRLGAADFSDPMLNVSALVLFGTSILIAALAWSALVAPPGPGITRRSSGPMRWRSGLGSMMIATPLLLGLGMLALAPHLWLVLMSLGSTWSGDLIPQSYDLGSFRQLRSEALPGLGTTLAYAAGAGALTLLIGSAFAAITRRSGAISRALRFAANSLFAIPGVVLALAYARTQDLFDPELIAWPGFAWFALMLVVALKQLPLAQHFVAQSLRALHAGELESALSLGATRFTTWLRIGLPSLLGVLGAMFLLGGAAAVVELSAVLLLIKDPQAPLALSLFHALQAPATTATGAAQGLLLAALTAPALVLAYVLLRQRRFRATPPRSHQPPAARKDP